MSNKPKKGFLNELARPQKIENTVSKRFQYAKPVTTKRSEAIALATPSRLKNHTSVKPSSSGLPDELTELREQRKGRKA